jgi:hypothetical protein
MPNEKPTKQPTTSTNGETVRVWVNVDCLSEYVGRDMSQVPSVREYRIDNGTTKPEQK